MDRHSIAAGFLAMVALIPLPGAALDCSGWTLKNASGVIGKEHGYKYTATCSETWSTTKTGAGTSTTTNTGVVFAVIGGASWDRATGLAREKLSFEGDVSGSRYAEAVCTQDPFLLDPPGGPASCGALKVQVDQKSGPTYELLVKKSFWAARRFALVEAQSLSAEAAAAKASPPSQPVGAKVEVPVVRSDAVAQAGAPAGRLAMPSPGTTVRQLPPPSGSSQAIAKAPTLIEFEAEDLLKGNAVVVNGGNAVVQPMGAFAGSSWSGGQQLFWSGGSVGAVLDLLVDVTVPSKYIVELYMTRAPDYGQLYIEVDGKPAPVGFDGMSPGVVQKGPTQVGSFAMQAGQHRISFMISGKNAQSTGYYAGIDRLRLYPAGAIE